MLRRLRLAFAVLAHHVLYRHVGLLPLFDKPTDHAAFEKILAEARAVSRPPVQHMMEAPEIHHLAACSESDQARGQLAFSDV